MVEVLKTGFYDTIQDLGRFNVQDYGVPLSGAMDLYSAKLANVILGNDANDALLELTMIGPKLKFHCNALICLTGADLKAKRNTNAIKNNTQVLMSKNDVLSFGSSAYGCRAYLAVKGGFQTEHIMGSRSMYQHITSKSRLVKGDVLPVIEDHFKGKRTHASVKIATSHFSNREMEVYKGPEFDSLSRRQQTVLFGSGFSISKDSNRMAYQFIERIDNNIEAISTSLVLPGTLQLTPSGQLIILMRDGQVTGGYPRILQFCERALNRLSQTSALEKIRLKCIEW